MGWRSCGEIGPIAGRLDGSPQVWHDRRRDGRRALDESRAGWDELGPPMTTREVAPGIYRIESILGPRPFAQYLLREERSLLVDTGIVSTPDEVILPAFRELGLDPADLDYVLISHADVDHF